MNTTGISYLLSHLKLFINFGKNIRIFNTNIVYGLLHVTKQMDPEWDTTNEKEIKNFLPYYCCSYVCLTLVSAHCKI